LGVGGGGVGVLLFFSFGLGVTRSRASGRAHVLLTAKGTASGTKAEAIDTGDERVLSKPFLVSSAPGSASATCSAGRRAAAARDPQSKCGQASTSTQAPPSAIRARKQRDPAHSARISAARVPHPSRRQPGRRRARSSPRLAALGFAGDPSRSRSRSDISVETMRPFDNPRSAKVCARRGIRVSAERDSRACPFVGASCSSLRVCRTSPQRRVGVLVKDRPRQLVDEIRTERPGSNHRLANQLDRGVPDPRLQFADPDAWVPGVSGPSGPRASNRTAAVLQRPRLTPGER